MALPTSTIPITSGAGTITAAELVSSKYYGTPMLAGPAGHVLGTRPSFIIIVPPVAGTVATANKVHFDMFNAAGSGNTVEVHGIYANINTDVAMAQALGLRLDIFRTSTVGTGGTAIGNEQTSVTNTISAIDPADVGGLPAQITARVAPTGGATIQAFIGQTYLTTEEVSTNFNYFTQWQNLVRYEQMEDVDNLTLPEGYGLKIIQGPVVVSSPNLGFRVVFTLR